MRGIWDETPRGLRVGCVALRAVGAVLIGLGWRGDQAGFWADKVFLTHVFWSVTAAPFAAPLPRRSSRARDGVFGQGPGQATHAEVTDPRQLPAGRLEGVRGAAPGLR